MRGQPIGAMAFLKGIQPGKPEAHSPIFSCYFTENQRAKKPVDRIHPAPPPGAQSHGKGRAWVWSSKGEMEHTNIKSRAWTLQSDDLGPHLALPHTRCGPFAIHFTSIRQFSHL